MRGKKLLLLSVSLLLVIPCAAAAAFAFRFGIEPQEPAASTQQERQTGDEQKKEALKRRALEEKEMQERGIVELKEALQKEIDPERRAKLEAKLKRVAEEQAQSESEIRAFALQGNPAELKLRRAQEEEEMKARQAELARQAKITMDQAIQIATSLNPGKVLECSLIGEHWEAPGKLAKDGMVLYHVVILSPDEANPSTIHVLVNAVDGTILKAEKEMRRKPER